jgi:hypothetical protein
MMASVASSLFKTSRAGDGVSAALTDGPPRRLQASTWEITLRADISILFLI